MLPDSPSCKGVPVKHYARVCTCYLWLHGSSFPCTSAVNRMQQHSQALAMTNAVFLMSTVLPYSGLPQLYFSPPVASRYAQLGRV